MQFLQTIKNSIANVAFYTKAKTEPFGKSLKYFSLLTLCMAILIAIPFSVSLFTWSSSWRNTDTAKTIILNTYPDELVLTLRDKHLTSNVDEPYTIAFPKVIEEKTPKNLALINTQGTITPADFDTYDTLTIFGSDALWVRNPEDGKIEIWNFDQLGDETIIINEQMVSEITSYALRIANILFYIIFPLAPLFIFVFFFTGNLIYLLFGACIIWLIAKLRKTHLTYGQSYKLGLYLLTLPILYGAITMLPPLAILKVPYVFTCILAILAYRNLAPDTSLPQVTPPSQPVSDTPTPPLSSQ